MTDGWPKASCVMALQQAAERLGRPPTIREFNDIPGPSSTAVTNHFESWNDALLSVGLSQNESRRDDVPIPTDVIGGHRESYSQGYRARLEGVAKEHVPYQPKMGGIGHRNAWVRGWEAADSRASVCEVVDG